MEKELNFDKISQLEQRSDELAQFFRALSDPTRIKILFLISDKEMCVSQVADLLHMTEGAVSHQFRVLRMNKLVKRTRRGKELCYRLNDSHMDRIMSLGRAIVNLYTRSFTD